MCIRDRALDMLLYNMNVLLPGADTASAVGESGGEPEIGRAHV